MLSPIPGAGILYRVFQSTAQKLQSSTAESSLCYDLKIAILAVFIESEAGCWKP